MYFLKITVSQVSIASYEKLAINLAGVPLYVLSHFSFAAFKTFVFVF